MHYFIYLTLLFLYSSLGAYDNVAAKYCDAMGYEYMIQIDKNGGEAGACLLDNYTKVDAWAFYKGKVAKEFSYCAKNGYSMITKRESKENYITDTPICEPKLKTATSQPINMLEMMKKNDHINLQSGRISTSKSVTSISKNSTSDVRESSTLKSSYPDDFDWRDYDGHSYIGGIRDQGSCGSCYAFAAAASAEGTYNFARKKYDNNVVDFSESYIAWCLGTYGPYVYDFDGCNGASYAYKELEALTKEGITYEVNFPYTEEDPGACTHQDDPVVIFAEWGRVDVNDTDAIREVIRTYGVIDVAVNVISAWQNYESGIYSDAQTGCPDGDYTETNHAVALVGWGTDETEGLYWILRNSWGIGWGEDGYMRTQAHSARVACAATYLKAKVPFNPANILYLLD